MPTRRYAGNRIDFCPLSLKLNLGALGARVDILTSILLYNDITLTLSFGHIREQTFYIDIRKKRVYTIEATYTFEMLLRILLNVLFYNIGSKEIFKEILSQR